MVHCPKHPFPDDLVEYIAVKLTYAKGDKALLAEPNIIVADQFPPKTSRDRLTRYHALEVRSTQEKMQKAADDILCRLVPPHTVGQQQIITYPSDTGYYKLRFEAIGWIRPGDGEIIPTWIHAASDDIRRPVHVMVPMARIL